MPRTLWHDYFVGIVVSYFSLTLHRAIKSIKTGTSLIRKRSLTQNTERNSQPKQTLLRFQARLSSLNFNSEIPTKHNKINQWIVSRSKKLKSFLSFTNSWPSPSLCFTSIFLEAAGEHVRKQAGLPFVSSVWVMIEDDWLYLLIITNRWLNPQSSPLCLAKQIQNHGVVN